MKASKILEELEIYHCIECKCALGDDWEFQDFSNKSIVICPQCKELYYIDELLNESEEK